MGRRLGLIATGAAVLACLLPTGCYNVDTRTIKRLYANDGKLYVVTNKVWHSKNRLSGLETDVRSERIGIEALDEKTMQELIEADKSGKNTTTLHAPPY